MYKMARRGGKKIYRRRKMQRRRGGKRTVLVNKALSPFAQRYLCKMKYAEIRSVTGPIGGGLAQYNFNLNSIYDPNLSGIGHQPYGYDQLADLYNRYRVFKVDYAISALTTDAAGVAYSVLAALPANEAISGSLGVAEVMENPRAKYITQAPNAALKVLKGSVSLPSLVGRSKSQYMSDDRYQAAWGASPAEQAVLNIMAGTIAGSGGNGGTATNTMTLSVSLVYHVECFDVKNQIQS